MRVACHRDGELSATPRGPASPGGLALTDAANALTIREIIASARARLPPEVWDYLVGGAESETTLRRNALAFERWTFRPRVLQNVSNVDISTTVLGLPLSLPVALAPIGSLALFDDGAAAASARAAGAGGSVSFVGLMSQPSLEEVAAAAPGRPQIFQIYIRGDERWLDELVARVEETGYGALCFTVDAPVYGRRERDLHNRYSTLQAVDRANLAGEVSGQLSGQVSARQAAFTWRSFDRVRSRTRLPIVLKGVQHPDDARLAVQHGANMVYVSNHGGRQLDHVEGTLALLPEIVDAVGGKAAIAIDGGVTRGSDVVKALALGADLVGLGKLHGLALAAGGAAGVARLLALLRDEIATTLALLGHTRLNQLSPDILRPASPLPPGRAEALAELSGDAFGHA